MNDKDSRNIQSQMKEQFSPYDFGPKIEIKWIGMLD